MKQFIITKKIAKHGDQAVIVIPRLLQDELSPQTVVKLTIDVLKEINEDDTIKKKGRSKLIVTLTNSKEKKNENEE